VKLNPGTVMLVEIDEHGLLPCIAVSDPAVNCDQSFPLIAVVPVTATPGEGALYPELLPGKSGLAKTCCALVDHLSSIDKRRIRRVLGMVTPTELEDVYQGIDLFLGMARE
jgi:mRNA-degrading endonuclease toxin of MazEF toxin-antitoxin module